MKLSQTPGVLLGGNGAQMAASPLHLPTGGRLRVVLWVSVTSAVGDRMGKGHGNPKGKQFE